MVPEIKEYSIKIENPPLQDVILNYTELIGAEKGPSLFIVSGVHGNELTGIELVRKLKTYLQKKVACGRIVLLALSNPVAFYTRQRKTVYDGKDLNRCFPGNKDGSITDKMACAITEKIIGTCDFGIDLHTGPEGRILMPHTKITADKNPKLLELSRIFGTLIAMPRTGNPSMLSMYALNRGIPALAVELGEANHLEKSLVQTGFFGCINVARYLGILKGGVTVLSEQFILNSRHNIAPSFSGLFFPKVKLGQVVEKGKLLAEIYNVENDESEKIFAEKKGIIMSIQTYSVALVGTTVLSILTLENRETNDVKLKGKITYYHSNNPEILWKEAVY